jgi:hypothetical protein
MLYLNVKKTAFLIIALCFLFMGFPPTISVTQNIFYLQSETEIEAPTVGNGGIHTYIYDGESHTFVDEHPDYTILPWSENTATNYKAEGYKIILRLTNEEKHWVNIPSGVEIGNYGKDITVVGWIFRASRTDSFTLKPIENITYKPNFDYTPEIVEQNNLKPGDELTFLYSNVLPFVNDENFRPSDVGTYFAKARITNNNYTTSVIESQLVLFSIAKATLTAQDLKTVEGKVTEHQIELEYINGAEYRIVGQQQWKTTSVFDGLEPNKEYSFVYRISGSKNYDDFAIGDWEALKVTTLNHDFGEYNVEEWWELESVEWETIKEPTVEKDGEERAKRICVNDDYYETKTRPIPKLAEPPKDYRGLFFTIPVVTFAFGVVIAIAIQLVNEKKQKEK